jgi:hypothetical protein
MRQRFPSSGLFLHLFSIVPWTCQEICSIVILFPAFFTATPSDAPLKMIQKRYETAEVREEGRRYGASFSSD